MKSIITKLKIKLKNKLFQNQPVCTIYYFKFKLTTQKITLENSLTPQFVSGRNLS